MSDIVADVSMEAFEAWLAAYALGLAYSETTDQQRLTQLVEVTRDHPELLVAAHRRLDGADVAEHRIRDEALRLLDRAMVRTGHDRPRAPAP